MFIERLGLGIPHQGQVLIVLLQRQVTRLQGPVSRLELFMLCSDCLDLLIVSADANKPRV